MPDYRIDRRHLFPDPELGNEHGLLGVGGDLDPDRLLLAYSMGIFPWYSADQPILWWSPDPRMVLLCDELRIPRSLGKVIRRGEYEVTFDRAFPRVIEACGEAPRPGQPGTWITPEMKVAYLRLHQRGFAHSVEAWRDGELVGGLYGVALGRLFAGESMFARAPDASKVAFVKTVVQLRRWGFPLVDSQVHTDHVARFGGREIPRREYLARMRPLVMQPGRPGPWTFDADLGDWSRP